MDDPLSAMIKSSSNREYLFPHPLQVMPFKVSYRHHLVSFAPRLPHSALRVWPTAL